MTKQAQMRVTIKNKWGLHARASFRLASMAMNFNARITLEKNEQAADAKKMDELLLLTAGPGDEIIIKAQGPDEDLAVERLAELVNSGFCED